MSKIEQDSSLLVDDDLIDAAIRFVVAEQKSASVDVIGPKRWWQRAKTALETAAACAESWPHMVGEMGRKLQIQYPTRITAQEIAKLKNKMQDPLVFERFRYLCQRDALYIIAMVRNQKEEMKKTGGSKDAESNRDD